MKVVAFSDIHGNVAALKDARERIINRVKPDVVVVCGDITHLGGAEVALQVLRALEGLHVFYVWGNMDSVGRNLQLPLEGMECIHGRIVSFGGVDFVGLSANFDPKFLLSVKKSENPMVVVSHEPPRGCCDKAWSGMNIGNKHLRSFVESVMPELVFCGHVHEARGSCQLGATIVVNVGKCSEGGAVATLTQGSFEVNLI
ncbi:MAG: metallophosphoesterase family protein [Candidatus Jordarchaeales archaeon]|nr:metallophosphoesterase family protein [Candidatus Jordarchaeia archaeon]